jgi:hypothetical protein
VAATEKALRGQRLDPEVARSLAEWSAFEGRIDARYQGYSSRHFAVVVVVVVVAVSPGSRIGTIIAYDSLQTGAQQPA